MKKLKRIRQAGWKLIRRGGLLGLLAAGVFTAQALPAKAQDGATAAPAQAGAAAPAAAPAPPPFVGPAITGPLAGLPPFTLDAGFGKVAVNGIITGFGMWQSNHVPGDDNHQATLSNGQVFVAKTDGWFQFFVQGGVYAMPALATPFLAVDKTVTNFYGPVPVGYVKLAPQNGGWKNTSIEIGALPTLMGAETTFTFENMNIERGLLWNQENAVNRGIQLNQGLGKYLTLSVSWNDGYYSGRYNWMSGLLTVTKGPHSLAFSGMGNLGQTAYSTAAAPLDQNNSSMYALIYTFTKGPWIIQPYWQYSNVPKNLKIGISKGATTNGGAILISHAFKKGFSLAGRWEYIGSSGNATDGSENMLGFGPGSKGMSLTGTPTFQYGGFFFRGDISWVHATDYVKGSVFGPLGTKQDQARLVGEIGFIFGKTEK